MFFQPTWRPEPYRVQGRWTAIPPRRFLAAPGWHLVTPGGHRGGPCQRSEGKNLERATRRFWHALALAIDAKLGAAAAGIATLESEFLAHVVLPGNRTVLDELEPFIDSAYRSGRHPSFGGPAPSLPAAEPRIIADLPCLRVVAEPAILDPGPSQLMENLAAQGVGRILQNLVRTLGDLP